MIGKFLNKIRVAILKLLSPRLAAFEAIPSANVSWIRNFAQIDSKPFNGDEKRQILVKAISEHFGAESAIETGTFVGNTTQWLAQNFRNVTSIELDPGFYALSILRLGHFNNIKLYKGSSGTLIHQVVDENIDNIVFAYLDAHSRPKEPPLQDELAALFRHGRSAVLIDDFFVPDSSFGYGTYDGKRLDLDLIRPALPQTTRVFAPRPDSGYARGWAFLVFGALEPALESFAQSQNLQCLSHQ